MGKKGSMDLIFLVIFLFVIALSAILVVYTYSQITDTISETVEGESLEVMEGVRTSLNFLDYFFLMVFIGMMVAMIILAFMIRSHPALFFLFIIILFITVIISISISNAYYELSMNNELVTTISTNFRITDFLMRNLPLEVAIFGIILMIVTYSKAPSGGPV